MRKVTIADFGRDESDRYARLQSLVESVWSAHHESRIIQHHARVSVATAWLGDDRFREIGLEPVVVGQSRFSERLDMSHYKHPLRKPSWPGSHSKSSRFSKLVTGSLNKRIELIRSI